MKLFLVKSLLFMCCLGSIIFGSEFVVPYYWGAPDLVGKITYYKQHKNDFNTLFIGSSHIYRHIDPSLFDKLTDGKTRSFNFGIAAMGSLETYAFYEDFLRKDVPPQVKYVIIELLPISHIPPSILHSTRVKYYLNYPRYALAVNYFKSGLHEYPKEKVEPIIDNYTTAYIENLFKIAMLKEIFLFNFQPPVLHKEIIGKNNDGFCSIDDETSEEITSCVECRLTDKEIYLNLKDANAAYTQHQTMGTNMYHLQIINKLIEQSENKGINLIFYLPAMSNYKLMLPIFNHIDVRHKLDLANPMEFPEFYKMDLYYDRGHFNYKGAKLFTEHLAVNFDRLLADYPHKIIEH